MSPPASSAAWRDCGPGQSSASEVVAGARPVEGARRRRRSSRVRSATTCLRIASTTPARVAGGAMTCTRAPSGREAASRGCSRLMPWFDRLAIWRARRQLGWSRPARATSCSSSSPPMVSTQTSARPGIDEDVGHVRHGPGAGGAKGRQIGLEIDARSAGQRRGVHRTGVPPTPVKSRSRATKMLIGAPCWGTLDRRRGSPGILLRPDRRRRPRLEASGRRADDHLRCSAAPGGSRLVRPRRSSPTAGSNRRSG